MKTAIACLVAAVCVPLFVWRAIPVHADASIVKAAAAAKPPVFAPEPIEIEAVASPAQEQPKSEDPWYAPLRARVEELSDAYMDRPHTHRGLPAGEPPLGRELRLNRFTGGVLSAVRARAGELAQFGPDAAWSYAVTLACIAHRETRIASNPGKLGDQDNGRAAGYWQIWERRDHADRFSADTALEMLINQPGSSWSLPKGHPWTGYPECNAWLAAHPAP